MPYADLEVRKAYHRRYQRERRWGLMDAHRKIAIYVCPRHPFCRLGPGIAFENAFLITDKIEIKTVVEAHGDYGRFIFKIKLDFCEVVTEDDENE